MSLAMISSVYTGANQSGTARVFGVSSSQRYNALTSSELSSQGIYQNLSSATVYRSSRSDATLLLFRPPFSFLPAWPDFNGSFLQITNRKANSGPELDVDSFSASGFNDQTTSMLLVAANKDTELRLSFRDLFLSRWRTTLDNQLAGSEARRQGDPTLTWEMFPSGISYLSSSRRYLKIHQRLRVELSWWPDYDASITYHLYLYLDGAGRLRGHVARWAYWVEGGIKSGAIGDRLRPQVISGMDTLNDQLGDQLGGLTFTFADLYYLPGRQLSRPATGVLTGNTTDDVTIVLQA